MRNTYAPVKDVTSLLALTALPSIGKQSATKLASTFDSVGALLDADDAALRSILSPRGLASIRDANLWDSAWQKAEVELSRAESLGIRIISRFDATFPDLLALVPDPPLLLYVKGVLRSCRRRAACVGTREPSVFGRTVADRLTRHLASNGWEIVSGLATGIDTDCHESALAVGGVTIAVLANGLDSVYPSSNKRLADRIISSGGALLSEQPLGARAFAANLIQRDRLQSGLSVGTLVMQTDVIGGTMHTVRFTIQQRRLLVVPVPGGAHRNEAKSQGLIALLEQTGRQLADTLRADNDVRQILFSEFGDRRVAWPVRGIEDYPALLAELDAAAALTPEARSKRDASSRSEDRLF